MQKGLFEEYASFGRGHSHDLAPFDTYHKTRGLRWPVVDGKETLWRFREGYDPYVQERSKGVKFYGNKDGKAWIFALPYDPPAESPDKEFDLWLSHRARARALALRLHDPARAGTVQGGPGCGGLHEPGRRQGARSARGMAAKIASRRGEIAAARRDPRPQQAARGTGLHPLVRCSRLVNKLTLDATCPISKETDYKKCAVKVEKA